VNTERGPAHGMSEVTADVMSASMASLPVFLEVVGVGVGDGN
jgi:hypothetical protein